MLPLLFFKYFCKIGDVKSGLATRDYLAITYGGVGFNLVFNSKLYYSVYTRDYYGKVYSSVISDLFLYMNRETRTAPTFAWE